MESFNTNPTPTPNPNPNRTPLFGLFRDLLNIVADRYGPDYSLNPEFIVSKDKYLLDRLAELVVEESKVTLSIARSYDPSLN